MKTSNKSIDKSEAFQKRKTKKIIISSVAISAAGILGYFGWQYWKKKKEAKNGGDVNLLLQTTSPAGGDPMPTIPTYIPPKITTPTIPAIATNPYNHTPATYSTPATSSPGFPLKKGSKGENVRRLQQALIAKYGKSILPRYGADGDFGSETVAALKRAGLPASINESTFNVLTQGTKPGNSTVNMGKDLYTAAIARNYNKVLSLLKKMQSVEDYTTANETFKQNRIAGVRQTIVNGLLNTFTSSAQKEAIKFEFLRIGLQFDGDKWSLSGFDGRPIVTSESTTVWVNATEGVKVPARMVLGNEVSKRLDYTLFENNGKYFLVTTKSIQYLN